MGFGAAVDDLSEAEGQGQGQGQGDVGERGDGGAGHGDGHGDGVVVSELRAGLLGELERFVHQASRRGGVRRRTAEPDPDPLAAGREVPVEVGSAVRALDELQGLLALGCGGDAAQVLGWVAQIRAMAEAAEAAAVQHLLRTRADVNAGFRNPTSAVKTICKAPHGQASGLVGAATRVGDMPLTRAAWAEGSISKAHVERLCSAAGSGRLHLFVQAETWLVEAALRLPFTKFCNVVAHFELGCEPDIEDAAKREHAKRSAEMRRSRRERGGGTLNATFDPVGFSAFHKVLRTIERELFDADWADATAKYGEGNVTLARLGRTATQRRADALVEMAARAAAVPAGARKPAPMVVIHIAHDVFEAELKRRVGADFSYPPHFTAELDDGTPISPGEALALAVEGEIRRLIYDGPGIRTQYGRTKRFAPQALKEMIEARDRECQAPGCDTPAWECDTDHIIDWQYLGQTNGDELEAKCRWHNRVKDNYHTTTDPVTNQATWTRKQPLNQRRE